MPAAFRAAPGSAAGKRLSLLACRTYQPSHEASGFHWAEVRIIFRGDSGFCRSRMLAWCERHDVGYNGGIARNTRLNEISAQWQQAAEQQYASSSEKIRWFGQFLYAAKNQLN